MVGVNDRSLHLLGIRWTFEFPMVWNEVFIKPDTKDNDITFGDVDDAKRGR